MVSSEVLTLERDGPLGILWLDRPERLNAMGPAFWEDLPRMMADLGEDGEVQAVVITARGPHFSVGLDLTATTLPGGGQGDGSGDGRSAAARSFRLYREVKRLQTAITSVAECPKPVIAAVHGYCLGGGLDLVCACDIRLAAADAIFSVRETRMAMVADLGSLQRLPRIVAAGHVAELAYTGKDIGAARAREIGLVNDVLPDAAAAVAAARALGQEIAANSPLAVQGTKAVLAAGRDRSVADGLDYVATWNAAFLLSEDLEEALSAFVERRPAQFRGR